ncbi:MAG: hypothetical protein LBU27_09450, partial [Candidatus Peribacteria bacterium]|nr:hypothetical protein [Candidatus Peribacteria bacterium]
RKIGILIMRDLRDNDRVKMAFIYRVKESGMDFYVHGGVSDQGISEIMYILMVTSMVVMSTEII